MIAVVIINYKSQVRTINFVKNEIVRITIPYKVVIVNNQATPESDGELGKGLDARIVQVGEVCDDSTNCYVISNPHNSGFAKGNNLGARFAIDCFGADFLLFSNNDIKFLDDQVVERLVDKLRITPKAGLIGPRVVGLDGKLQSPEPYMSFWNRHIWMYLCTPFYSKEKKSRRFQFDYAEQAEEGFHYKIMGSFFLTRAEDFEKCGRMDENTFLYSEETILTERMKSIGLSPYYYPSVSVLHEHGSTMKSYFSISKQIDMLFESECYFYSAYRHTPQYQIWLGRVVCYIRKFLM